MTNKIKESNISDGAVTSDKIAPGTIANDRLAGSISNDKLAGSIANAKLANSSITINGTTIALGASGDIVAGTDWQSVITADGSTATTAVAGEGYFIDTTSNTHTINLPASPSLGDQVTISDVAGTFATNNVTVGRNSSKINGASSDVTLSDNDTQRTFAYSGSTYGWIDVNADNQLPVYITATGGTETTDGSYRIHTFNSSGCFTVSCAGNQSTTVDYLVVAGGGGGGGGGGPGGGSGAAGSGGGAGGFRESKDSGLSSPHTASPLAATTGITVTAQTYPITVGAGGAAGPLSADAGSGGNSSFSTITSTGGGKGGKRGGPACSEQGNPGGSGGGSSQTAPTSAGGTGNTPPVSPPQGQPGGFPSAASNSAGSGGGGASTAGSAGIGNNPAATNVGGAGGNGVSSSISGSSVGYAGGGGGGGGGDLPIHPSTSGGAGGSPGSGGRGADLDNSPAAGAGGTNVGGGGGGGSANPGAVGGNGGSGVVILRYRYQT